MGSSERRVVEREGSGPSRSNRSNLFGSRSSSRLPSFSLLLDRKKIRTHHRPLLPHPLHPRPLRYRNVDRRLIAQTEPKSASALVLSRTRRKSRRERTHNHRLPHQHRNPRPPLPTQVHRRISPPAIDSVHLQVSSSFVSERRETNRRESKETRDSPPPHPHHPHQPHRPLRVSFV